MLNYILFFIILIPATALCATEDAALDVLVATAIQEHTFPGAVILINQNGNTIYHKAFGRYTYEPDSPPVTRDTLFDIASLTKVVATTTLTKLLCDAGKLSLEDRVITSIPEFKSAEVCIKHLLTHTSGIRESLITYSPDMTAEGVWHIMLNYPIDSPPGSRYQYTCTNAILLQKIIEKITGLSFAECIKSYLTSPLEMPDTQCHPVEKSRCAPTRAKTPRGETIQGDVNDDRAFMLGGCAGNAGLFSTARDLEKFMLMSMKTKTAWTEQQCPCNRGYGWEIGRHLSPTSFGHFGWTGTSIWADREKGLFCIILTNHTYPDDNNRVAIRRFREQFHELILATRFAGGRSLSSVSPAAAAEDEGTVAAAAGTTISERVR